MCFRPPSFEEMMKKCPNCGSFNPPELEKCKKCSTDLPEAVAPEEGAAPAAAAPKGPGAAPKGPGAPAAPAAPSAPKPPAGS